MGKELLGRCGCRCDLCLAYKANVEKTDQRVALSAGWAKCFGLGIPAEKIYCEGCTTAGNPQIIDSKCPVRACVIGRGLDNCSQCAQYPCQTFSQRAVVYEDIAKDRKDITESDRALFIKPYENKARLDELRAKRNGG